MRPHRRLIMDLSTLETLIMLRFDKDSLSSRDVNEAIKCIIRYKTVPVAPAPAAASTLLAPATLLVEEIAS